MVGDPVLIDRCCPNRVFTIKESDDSGRHRNGAGNRGGKADCLAGKIRGWACSQRGLGGVGGWINSMQCRKAFRGVEVVPVIRGHDSVFDRNQYVRKSVPCAAIGQRDIREEGTVDTKADGTRRNQRSDGHSRHGQRYCNKLAGNLCL